VGGKTRGRACIFKSPNRKKGCPVATIMLEIPEELNAMVPALQQMMSAVLCEGMAEDVAAMLTQRPDLKVILLCDAGPLCLGFTLRNRKDV